MSQLTPAQRVIFSQLKAGQTVTVAAMPLAGARPFRIAPRVQYGLEFYGVLSATSAAQLMPYERFSDDSLTEWVSRLAPVCSDQADASNQA